MITIGLAGTAGRKSDIERLDRTGYFELVDLFDKVVEEQIGPGPHLIRTGGAAWVDHIGVTEFLRGKHQLELCLPCGYDAQANRFLHQWGSGDSNTARRDKLDGLKSPASTADYYHGLFSQRMGRDTREGLSRAIQGGCAVEYYDGFHARNLVVGASDYLVCMTFGSGLAIQKFTPGMSGWHHHRDAGVKPGGTAHCWDNSKAQVKIHCNLNLWLLRDVGPPPKRETAPSPPARSHPKSLQWGVNRDQDRIYTRTPYNPGWPAAAKELGGNWIPDLKAWVFDASVEAEIRALMDRIYGTTNGEDPSGDNFNTWR
jgi:hypothetical protein